MPEKVNRRHVLPLVTNMSWWIYRRVDRKRPPANNPCFPSHMNMKLHCRIDSFYDCRLLVFAACLFGTATSQAQEATSDAAVRVESTDSTKSSVLEENAVTKAASVIDLGSSPDRVRFTFQNAAWSEVLREFSQWAGLTLDMSDTPPGDFSYFDNRMHTPQEAIDILNGYLLPRGYVLLRRDKFLVCLATDNEMLSNLIPTVSVEKLDSLGENDLVRVIVPVEEITPDAAAEEVGDVLGPFGEATPLPSSRSIMLRGFGSGLRQALDILSVSRPPVTDDKLDFRSYPIKFLPVADAERQIRNLFGVEGPGTARNVSGARSDMDRMRFYRERGGRDNDRDRDQNAAPTIPLLKRVAMNMQVSSLERTNTLLVTATPEGLGLVEDVLESIDVPSGSSTPALVSSNQPDLRVYGMVSADEGEVAKTIDVLMPGVIVNEDRRQDTIHVFGDEQQHREVERLIRILDVNEGGKRDVEVIPLRRSNPSAVASFLNEMFSNDDRDERPMVRAELASRSIIVRGTDNQIEQVRDALQEFGEPGIDESRLQSTPRIRRIEVGKSRAGQVAKSAERLFSMDSPNGIDIRVVIPGEGNDSVGNERPLRQNRTGSGNQVAPETTIETIETLNHSCNSTPRERVSRLDDSILLTDAVVSSSLVTRQDPSAALPAQVSDRAKVRIEVAGDDLMISSGDPEALQAVESTIRELVRQMPSRTSWTVFYLRVAEAQRAATQLYELVNDSLLMTSGNGVFLTDQTVEPLRIIPDQRTNALFVSGVQEQVDEVEKFLGFIDATEVPGSFIDRKPHAIEVQYADVNEVAELLRTLYKDYLVDPVAERARARRSRSNDDRDRADDDDESRGRSTQNRSPTPTSDSPGIRLTLAVDTVTGELLVACNDQLFKEIESVVKQRDEAARERQPTIEVITMPEGIQSEVMQALEMLSPQIEMGEVPASTSSQRGTERGSRDIRRGGSDQDRRQRSSRSR